jgi:small subunit ribosomal protein S16
MVTIRLTRVGRKNLAFYRIVIANKRSKRDGDFIAYVGTYDPKTKPSTVVLEKDLVKDWLAKGAQPTETVKRLLVNAGLIAKPKKTEVKIYKSKPGKKALARAAKKAEAKKTETAPVA